MKGELRKKQILDCAKQIFSEKGYYDTQVEDIIKLARIGKGTIYQYFRNKEDVFFTLLDRFFKEWEEEVSIDPSEIYSSEPYTHPAVNYVHIIIMKTLRFFLKDIERGNIILRIGPGLNVHFENYMREFENKIVASIIEGIKLGQKFGNIESTVNIDIMSNFLLGGVMRVAYQFLILEKNSISEIDLEKLAEDIVYNIRNGIFNFVYRK